MVEFSSVWRRRHACQRCRQLKVRCDYASPAAKSCVRCTRQGAECITRDKPNERGSPPHSHDPSTIEHSHDNTVEQNGVLTPDSGDSGQYGAMYKGPGYGGNEVSPPVEPASGDTMVKPHGGALLQMLMNARKYLSELGSTPLAQAYASGVFTYEEATRGYQSFIGSEQLFPLPMLPLELKQLDEQYPKLALAIVSAMALGTNSRHSQERLCLIQENFGQVFGVTSGPAGSTPLDSQLAMCVLTAYTLPYHERGLSRLFHMHAVTLGELRKLNFAKNVIDRQRVVQTGALAVLPYALVEEFQPVLSLLPIYMSPSVRQYLGHAAPVVDAVALVVKGIKSVENCQCALALTTIYEENIFALDLLECQTAGNTSAPAAAAFVFILAKMKFMRAVAVAAASFVRVQEIAAHDLLTKTLESATILSGKMARAFANRDGKSSAWPSFTYFYMGDLLICCQALRFIAFAASIDVDVKTTCLHALIHQKWMDLASDNFVARQSFVSLFKASDMLHLRIGCLVPSSNEVLGPGSMPTFEIFNAFDAENLFSLGNYTHEELLEIFEKAIKLPTTSPKSSPLDTVGTDLEAPLDDPEELAGLSHLSLERMLRVVLTDHHYV